MKTYMMWWGLRVTAPHVHRSITTPMLKRNAARGALRHFPKLHLWQRLSPPPTCFNVGIYSYLRGNLQFEWQQELGRAGGCYIHGAQRSFCWFIIRREPRAPSMGRSNGWGGRWGRRRGWAGARLMDTKWTNYDGPLWVWWGQTPCALPLTVQFPPNAAPFADC